MTGHLKVKRWNHNIHYHPLILAAAPPRCRRALDVGCGEGGLTRELREVSELVVGIDVDPGSIARARASSADTPEQNGVDYVSGDLLDHPFEPASFDLVASVAALHHMDAESALRCMARLLRPGGRLVVIGLAQSRSPLDFVYDVLGAFSTRFHRFVLRKRYWEHGAPIVWPPPHSYRDIRETAARVLPGSRYRRHVLWRYSLMWTAPESEASVSESEA